MMKDSAFLSKHNQHLSPVSAQSFSSSESDLDNDFTGTQSHASSVKEQLAKAEADSVIKWKIAVSISLLATSVLVVAATYLFLTTEEKEGFETAFENLAGTMSVSSHFHARNIIETFQGMSDTITSLVIATNLQWPFIVLPNAEVRFAHLRHVSFTEFVGFSPIVQARDREDWETFSIKNQEWIQKSRNVSHEMATKILENVGLNATTATTSTTFSTFTLKENTESIPAQIHIVENGEYTIDDSWGPYAPMWQMSPPPMHVSIINHNLLYDTVYGDLLRAMQVSNHSVLSGIMDVTKIFDHVLDPQIHNQRHSKNQFNTELTASDHPHSVFVQPIYDTYDTEQRDLVGMLEGLLSWDIFLKDLLPIGVNGIVGVVHNTCNESFTYEIDGRDAYYIGNGDLHEKKFDEYLVEIEFDEFDAWAADRNEFASGQCHYALNLYPSSKFRNSYNSARPELFTIAVAFIFFVTGVTFFIFNYCVVRQQRKLILTAERTNVLVSTLFPKNVRERIMKDVEAQINTQTTESDFRISFFREAPKLRLKHYLNDGNKSGNDDDDDAHNTGFFNTKPIADLFPEVTVLFADIVGFTAWSSVREPSQVFQLLETIFWSFDSLAKRRRVFKVETVGDCYVAATGLPDPRNDHAVIMARFARDCMYSVHDLTRKLEVTLGPDTGDLTMRFGLHSGPITAGVLRGEKSRFQLFGDTMNTASRIETTGLKDHIHLSQETADLIIAGGKGKWVTPRKNKVVLKGKGEVQTFWLSVMGETSGNGSVNSSTDTGSENFKRLPEELTLNPQWTNQVVTKNGNDKKNDDNYDDADDEILLDPKMQRIVSWNVDQLIKLLKPVVARTNCLQREARQRDAKIMSSNKNGIYKIDKKGTVLEEVKEIIELPKFDAKTFKTIENPDMIELSSEVVNQLHDYVTSICKMYKMSNPFHNFDHASHVTMSVCKLLSRIVAPEDVDYDDVDPNSVNKDEQSGNFASALHDHTYGITSDPLTQFAVAFSALIHDVDHSGVPNAQLIKENIEIATLYKNKSVAEQNSVDLSWDLLMREKYADLRNAIFASEADFTRFRQLVVNSVMATDIVDKELKDLRNSRWAKAFSTVQDKTKTQQDLDDDRNRKATIVIEHLIQASDVAHTMQHWHIYRKWNERFFNEMYLAYKTGRSAFDPSVMWYKGEIGFFDFYIIPLARKLKDCGVFGVSSDEYLNFALMNRAEWVSKGESVVTEMLEKAQRDQTDTFRH